MKRIAIVTCLVFLTLGPLSMGSAADLALAGSFDRSFGTGGVVTGPVDAVSSIGGIAVQSDGKIVVEASDSVARYLRNGSLDSSFGNGGYVATGFDAESVALQPDGKIVVGGSSEPVGSTAASEFTVARYNPNGSLDTTFGTNGVTNTVIPEPTETWGCAGEECPWYAGASALAILPGGKIVAAGTVWGGADPAPPDSPPWSSYFALARYKPDGSLDPSFGKGGIVQTAFAPGSYTELPAELSGIVIQPNGGIVATGSVTYGGHGTSVAAMVLARYAPDGAVDFEAATNLKRQFQGGPPALEHGKILVAGSTLSNDARMDVVVRYERGNRLDTIFRKRSPIQSGIRAGETALAVQRDGKILLGSAGNAVTRLLPNGRRDTHFGNRGTVSLPFSWNSLPDLALQRNQKILVGSENGNAWTVTRLNGGNNCVVPGLHGDTIPKARTSLRKSYCRPGHIAKRFSDRVTPGSVISTTPPRGARLPDDATVGLVVSKGKGT